MYAKCVQNACKMYDDVLPNGVSASDGKNATTRGVEFSNNVLPPAFFLALFDCLYCLRPNLLKTLC